MSRDKLLIIGVVVLGVLGFLVYRQQQVDASLGTAAKATPKDLPTVSATDDVDKTSIPNGDKADIVLQKVADPTAPPGDGGPAMSWQIASPVKAAASQQTVKDLVANLKELKVESQVN